jgi:CDP-4-dehydro-6-deoxyglucose reductase
VPAYIATLAKTGAQFTVNEDETILDAAERAGILLAYSCRSGTCRSCLTRVLSGCAEHDPEYVSELNIDAGELAAHYRLLCSALACSDIILEK